jgi:hypothetical protein
MSIKSNLIQYVSIDGILTLAVADFGRGEVELTSMGQEVPWNSNLRSASGEAEIWALTLDMLLSEVN